MPARGQATKDLALALRNQHPLAWVPVRFARDDTPHCTSSTTTALAGSCTVRRSPLSRAPVNGAGRPARAVAAEVAPGTNLRWALVVIAYCAEA